MFILGTTKKIVNNITKRNNLLLFEMPHEFGRIDLNGMKETEDSKC